MTPPLKLPNSFIKNIIDDDLAKGKVTHIVTRFPPEPNGFLHIGHASAAYLNFKLAQEYPHSRCHLRLDDTNPEKEDMIYVNGIIDDLKWLGLDWGEHLYYASDYFNHLYEIAKNLIRSGMAYVCELSPDQMVEFRGTPKRPGRDSPFRSRPPEESLLLFEEMKAGKHDQGSMVLRAKIDMGSGNLHMRDPVMYRIKKAHHPRLGGQWNIYPSYDFAHCLSDAIEGITHSLCSLEFQDHRPLYDWFIARSGLPAQPHQYEFTRLNLNYTITSKRKLKQLVDEGHVNGWDDPRMPTISGMRNRGYPPYAIKNFCNTISVSRKETVIDMSILEECVRETLNDSCKRRLAILDPIEVTFSNYNSEKISTITLPHHPQKPEWGDRTLPFPEKVFIERTDFQEEPEKKYFRLAPEREVRLRGAYIIKCENMKKDPQGRISSLVCRIDYDTLGKKPADRKVKGVIHWVPADQSHSATIHEYDRLFQVESPEKLPTPDASFLDNLNPNSHKIHKDAILEPCLKDAQDGDTFQFERLGYFVARKQVDGQLYFNKVVSLKDGWAKAKG